MSGYSRAFLLSLLLLACIQLRAMGQNAKAPQECCFRFLERPIPHRAVESYEETRSDCPKAGIIFTTQKGKRMCADPGFKWVRNIMTKVDDRMVEST